MPNTHTRLFCLVRFPVFLQGFKAAVVGGFPLFGEKAARKTALVVPVVSHTGTALAVTGTVVGTWTWTGIAACVHASSPPFALIIPKAAKERQG